MNGHRVAGRVIVSTSCPSILELMAEGWAIVIVDRAPGPKGPITIGYIGKVTSDDSTGVTLGTPFDFQAAWLVHERGMTRHFDIVPTEAFVMSSIRVVRHQAIVWLADLQTMAVERIRQSLIGGFAMRDHFEKMAHPLTTP